MAKLRYKTRLLLVFSIFFLAFSILLARLFWLQVLKSEYLSRLADDQHNIIVQSEPRRGLIYDRNMHTMAVNLNVGSVYALPKEIKDKKEMASSLASLLSVDESEIIKKLKTDSPFVWVKRKMDLGQAGRVKELMLDGIGIVKETKRFYPNDQLASHIVGFVGIDDVGLEGLENEFDGYLRGTPGLNWTVRDAKARRILSKQSRSIPPCDGYSLVLTIEEVIQHIAEKELDRVWKEFKAKSASVIVMDPYNGDILALANRPTFNPNKFSVSDADSRRNRAITDLFEPGSVFKAITASAALETGLVGLDDTFFCEQGFYRVKSHTLHDHKPHGELSFKEVIGVSSNIGTVKVAQLLGKDEIYRFIKSFGFGSKTGIQLPGEVNGIIRPPKRWSGISIAAIPIGQEIAVTPVQLVSALSAIANGGILMKPRIILEIRDKEGGVVKNFEPVQVRRAISVSTASLMKEVLEGVVEEGTGRKGRLFEYRACGKTGTAQKVGTNGRYSHSKFIASFIGFAPVKNPRVVVLVCVDEPSPVYYGGLVAAPAFKRLTEGILRYLRVEPDREMIARK